jgi:hypothetical protein
MGCNYRRRQKFIIHGIVECFFRRLKGEWDPIDLMRAAFLTLLQYPHALSAVVFAALLPD